jgi:PBP1b-binding outer membrane lipoprotein LpoB
MRRLVMVLLAGLVLAGCGSAPRPPEEPDPRFCQPAFYFDEDGNLINLCPVVPA